MLLPFYFSVARAKIASAQPLGAAAFCAMKSTGSINSSSINKKSFPRSDTVENVLLYAEKIASLGVREIVLTGVNLGDFGNGTEVIEGQKPKKAALFIDLIQELDKMMQNPVAVEVRRERNAQPRFLSEKKKRAFIQRFLQTERPVLFEHSKTPGLLTGFTDNYVKVEVPFEAGLFNQIRPVWLERLNGEGDVLAFLVGKRGKKGCYFGRR